MNYKKRNTKKKKDFYELRIEKHGPEGMSLVNPTALEVSSYT